jgi:Ca-activated chloride channel family protein
MRRFRRRTLHAAHCALFALCLAWMNPTRDRIEEGNHLFKQGQYDAAISKYGEVLVNDPDSPLLNFNMGDANYKAGKYTDAINSFARVRAGEDDPKRIAKVAYNVGNAQYRLAAAAEAEKPEDALKAYAGALAAYRRALGADPTDQDAKFNYEFVSKKLDELKKKLEEQKQQEQQKSDQQQDQQQPQDQQQQKEQKDQQAQQQAQQDQNTEQKQQEQHQAAQQQEDEKKEAEQQQAAQAAGGGSGEKKDQMSQQEAAAVIDTAKNDEMQPDEFARQVQGGAVAEPAQDW